MAIIIKQAQSSQRLVEILEHRHHCLFRTNGKHIDHFDVLPTSYNFAATQEGKVIGSCRLIELDSYAIREFDQYPFRELTQKVEGNSGYIDLICIESPQHLQSMILQGLIKMSLLQAQRREMKFIFISFLSKHTSIDFGVPFQKVFEKESDFVIYSISLDDFEKNVLSKIADKEILRFRETFYYTIFQAGEVIVTEGDRGSSAFISEHSNVEIIIRAQNELKTIGTITPGQLIGEVAMLTNEKRTASLIAVNHTACISFDRFDFYQVLELEPNRSIEIFRIFSKRMKSFNQRLAKEATSGQKEN